MAAEEKKRRADLIVVNDGGPDALEAAVGRPLEHARHVSGRSPATLRRGRPRPGLAARVAAGVAEVMSPGGRSRDPPFAVVFRSPG